MADSTRRRRREAIRADLTRRTNAGQSDASIRSVYVARYGESILLNPPTNGLSLFVWVLPVVALALGAVGLAWRFAVGDASRGSRPPTPTRRSCAERARRDRDQRSVDRPGPATGRARSRAGLPAPLARRPRDRTGCGRDRRRVVSTAARGLHGPRRGDDPGAARRRRRTTRHPTPISRRRRVLTAGGVVVFVVLAGFALAVGARGSTPGPDVVRKRTGQASGQPEHHAAPSSSSRPR